MSSLRTLSRLVMAAFLLLGPVAAQPDTTTIAATPQRFYLAVAASDFATAWSLLTEHSKSQLSSLVADEAKMTADAVRQMFDANDARLQGGFWAALARDPAVKNLASAPFSYQGERPEGGFTVQAGLPGGETLRLVVKDESGYKYGLAESFGIGETQ
jgi:hypothetical protein